MKAQRIVRLVCIVLIIFGLGIETGLFIQRHSSGTLIVSKDSAAEFRLIEEAWNITRNNYVDQTVTRPQTLAYAAIDGMLNSLGDTGHSAFLTSEQVQQRKDFELGKLKGIGVEVRRENGSVVIVSIMGDSPAQKAGLQSGDIILQVNGQPVSDVADTIKLIQGPDGTSVTLTIQSPSGTKDVTLVIATIDLVNISWQQLPGTSIAHLRISSFSIGTSIELDEALAAIKTQEESGIILDLRYNPGGLLEEAIGVASRFLKSGNVLIEKDRNGKTTSHPVITDVTVTELPLVVLVNQGSASAAEIVAGALQDAGRALIVGEKTYGTGTVLNQFSLSDGSAIILGVGEWLTPSGKTIWHTGLTPDQIISLADGVYPLFPQSESDLTSSQLQTSNDQQLLNALDLLLRAN